MLRVLKIVEETNSIIIGGQSINILAASYFDRSGALRLWGPYTSKDIDFFYLNPEAVTRLCAALAGKLYLPTMDDNTPNAAVVVAPLGNRRISIDFMSAVLGVRDQDLRRRYVTLTGQEPTTGEAVNMLLMHPLDCLKSRLANINILGRRDVFAVMQAKASIEILRIFLQDLVESGEAREACRLLKELCATLRSAHVGHPSHLEIELDPCSVLIFFAGHPRLDRRYRTRSLAPAIADLERRMRHRRDRAARLAARSTLPVEALTPTLSPAPSAAPSSE